MYPIHQAGITGVTLDPDVELTLIHQDDWNMVGLPLGVEDSDYLTLFPDAINNTLYSFGEGYNLETELVEGIGYWLRFDGYGSNDMIGDDFEEITITLDEDWNIISGVSNPVDVNSISDPYGIMFPIQSIHLVRDTIWLISLSPVLGIGFVLMGKGILRSPLMQGAANRNL